jgi:hypothetical protein
VERFQKTFSALWKETLPQRTLGAVDGELNEFAMFAALQLACNAAYPNTSLVRGMLNRLYQYLLVKQVFYPSAIARKLKESPDFGPLANTMPQSATLVYIYGESDNLSKEDKKPIIDALDKTKMPWLVPACSYDDLKAKIEEAGADLFPGANIAGLVPEGVNASFDAKAYLWDADASREWSFEFRARTNAYNFGTACKDLNEKCNKSPEMHVLLVGISGVLETKVRVWLGGSERNKLRIVLLVGNKPCIGELD